MGQLNERTDVLGKAGTGRPQPDQSGLSLHFQIDHRLRGKRIAKYPLQDFFSREEGEAVIPTRSTASATRSAEVAAFRLLTGHDYLQGHLCRIGVVDTDVERGCTFMVGPE